ncbi:hypothetical protein EC957_004719 [Mortierella hygrophila]|uniref:Uncharacterized protein n=1 Tax=Mortierella hygrophila TaxID=979708 RepID=A0A9P6K069_9FUNG|nr:hypothetical protein EC957_004719 [Mortierella hygrophila]
MEPPSSDYMSVQDLSLPRRTPLQTQLEKIDPSIIRNGFPSTRINRRVTGRLKVDTETALFEVSVLAFREIILNRLWKNDKKFQNESDFCKHQWDILKPRKTLLIECAEVLKELSGIPVRPCSEQVCKALSQASVQLQPSALQRTSITQELWQRVLSAWRYQYRIQPDERVDVENISADFVNNVLFPPVAHVQQPQPPQQQPQIPQQQPQIPHSPHMHHAQHPLQSPHTPHAPTPHQPQATPRVFNQHPNHGQAVPTIAVRPPFTPSFTQPQPNQQAVTSQRHLQHQHPMVQTSAHTTPNNAAAAALHVPVAGVLPSSGSNSSATHHGSNSNSNSTSSASNVKDNVLFRDRFGHMLTDPRRFHAPTSILERVHHFFQGPPHLDPASFEGTFLDCPISVPFPDIMDSEAWLVPVPESNAHAGSMPQFAPVQSCFLHVPVLPSKRRYETENEVILLDDVRLAGQLNAKLWEEFSGGNVVEAITLVPTSATWFVKTELADWPCVVMSGLKFEQANGVEPSGKKYSEIHSYIVVYLGRDPLRQAQFVQTFQDLGISPPQVPENTLAGASSRSARPGAQDGQHRWIAGFRRLFRTQGHGSSASGQKGAGGSGSGHSRDGGHWTPQDDDDGDDIDPRFDDIYSILPPHKKARLERTGRPSDGQAAWHHSKRRKMDEEGFSKIKDPSQHNQTYGSDAEMSE